MFGMSMTELILVLAIALVVLGPERLPGFARAAGRAMREFRKASREIQASLQVEEVRRTLREQDKETREALSSLQRKPGDQAEVETTSSKPPTPVGGVVKNTGSGSDMIPSDDSDHEEDHSSEDEQKLRAYLDRSDRTSPEGESSNGSDDEARPPTAGTENDDS